MALRTIVLDGDPILKKVCRPVTNFDDRLAQLIDDMKETLVDANGLGLAAPQVGIMRRLCICLLYTSSLQCCCCRPICCAGTKGQGRRPEWRPPAVGGKSAQRSDSAPWFCAFGRIDKTICRGVLLYSV